MGKLTGKLLSFVMAAVITALPLIEGTAVKTAEAADTGYGIPGEIIGEWEYVGGSQPEDANMVWSRGNAYGVTAADTGKSYMSNLVDTTSQSYKREYEKLTGSDEKYDYLRQVKVAVLYIPECPYSKSYLPQFRQIAAAAGAPVLLIDATKYSAGLLPYYNSVMFGVTAPTVLYLDADETAAATGRALPMGKSKVHSTGAFAEILREAGYENAQDLPDGSGEGYSTEEEYERRVLIETNRRRIENGLLPLSTFPKLEEAADIRAAELLENMAHKRPNGTNFETVLNEMGIDASKHYAGENICGGGAVALPNAAVNAWMNSPGHRANILNENFSHMSAGYMYQDEDPSKYMDNWVQLFLGKCEPEQIELDRPVVNISIQGMPISDMDINLVLTCEHGESVIPLIDEMCTGYDSGSPGLQTAAVHYGDTVLPLEINVGNTEPHTLTDDMVEFAEDVSDIIYSGRAQTPAVRVSNSTGDYALIENYSYTVSYSGNINAGTAEVSVSGKGNYTGTVTKTFEIKPKNIDGMTVGGLEPAYEYTGAPITPSVTLSDGSRLLHEGIDYSVEYADNIGEEVKGTYGPDKITGTAVVTLTGMGNYTGTAEANFGFTLPELYKYSARVAYVLLNHPDYTSAYDFLKAVRESSNEFTYNMIIQQIEGVLNTADEAVGLDNIMAYPIYPAANKRLNEYYRFRAEADRGVLTEEIKQAPEVASDKINAEAVDIDGLGNVDEINADTGSVQLVVADTDKSAVNIDETVYDAVGAVALDISLRIDDTEAAELSAPVTVTVNIPEGFGADEELAVLHYKNGADSAPEELPVFTDGEKGTVSFVTDSFSPYVITRKLEVYDSGQTEAPAANDETVTGVSFGEENDLGPSAPENVLAYPTGSGEITVVWTPAEDGGSGWNVTGYKAAYSRSSDMSGETAVEINSPDANSAVLTGLDEGTYYITVSSVADSGAVSGAERRSVTVSATVYGDTASGGTDEPKRDWTMELNGGTLTLRLRSGAPAQEEITVYAAEYSGSVLTGIRAYKITPESGRNEYSIELGDAEGEGTRRVFLWDGDMRPLAEAL